MFVVEGNNVSEPITSMPGIERFSVEKAISEIKKGMDLGINLFAIFPSLEPSLKDESAKEALNKNNLMCRAVAQIKDAIPNAPIMVDIALDPYTTHGHDGVVINDKVANDETVDILTKYAVLLANAGADVVAPSDSMDGRVIAINKALEAEGHKDTLIISYAAKFCSSFYGPFRDAVRSTQTHYVDKNTYQINPSNTNEALNKIEHDIAEGADMIIVKPGLPYLDIVSKAKEYDVPILSYQVSGEYAMMKAASMQNMLDFKRVMLESLLCTKRAGASGILTYAATEVASWLQE
jgi:porphobilinogen synthase